MYVAAHPAADKAAGWLYVDGTSLPPIRRLLYQTIKEWEVRKQYKNQWTKPLAKAPVVSMSGAWATDGKMIYLRAPGDAEPKNVDVSLLAKDSQGALYLEGADHIIFNRLVFEKCGSAVVSMGASGVVLRHCIFNRNAYGYMGYGGKQLQPDILDHCLFWHNGGEFKGANAYFNRPMMIRYCLMVESGAYYPAIMGYNSKPNMFAGAKIIGNTILHGGAGITNTGRDVIVRDNIVLGSRFLSNAGTNVKVANNIAAYDPNDLKHWPTIPRRNIGFRAYGNDFVFTGNTLVGFAKGGNLYAENNSTGKKAFGGNQFIGYSDYALRVLTPTLGGLTCEKNRYAPMTDEASLIRFTPNAETKAEFDLSEWRKRGFGVDSKVASKAKPPVLPRVLAEALRKGSEREPPR